MPASVRLLALQTGDPQTIRFCLAFAAPGEGEQPLSAEAWLETGEGPALPVGVICEPSRATWRNQRLLEVALHAYTGRGPYTARLLLGDRLIEATATPGSSSGSQAAAAIHAKLVAFKLDDVEGRPLQRVVRWAVRGLGAGQLLRVDGGAAQACVFESDSNTAEQSGECRLSYAKPGAYMAALDLLDADGFWLATLAEYPLHVAASAEELVSGENIPAETNVPPYVPVADQPTAPPDDDEPWLAGRYARPAWGWLRTYSSPAEGAAVRVLVQGSYLSLRGETRVGDTLWYQTAGQDWVSGDLVERIFPSTLRGAELDAPPLPEAPRALKAGVVTAGMLNVRLRPGVQAGNVPREQLAAGTPVEVYEEERYGGTLWYRIGEERWVLGDHVRLLPLPRTPRPASRPPVLPVGWVVARALNVRRRPGLAPDNQPVGRVDHNQRLTVLDSTMLGGTPWYCVGEDRWVEGTWVALAQESRRPATIHADMHWVALSLARQTLVAYVGDRPVYAAMVATGRAASPTPAGQFTVRQRAERERMAGGSATGGSAYFIEDVPWVSYFHGGYALHGAYWHDSFGQPRSHGCANLSLYDAWWLYRWQVASLLIC